MKKFAFKFIVIILLSLCLIYVYNYIVQVDTTWTYVNDFEGAHTIISNDPAHSNLGFDIRGGKMATSNSNAPDILLFNIPEKPQANHQFVFIPVSKVNNKTVYMITAASDNNGRLDVKSGTQKEGQPIWFYEWSTSIGGNNNPSQRWFVRTRDGGLTYQIVLADNESFVMGISSGYVSGSKVVIITEKDALPSTFWKVSPVSGDFAIGTTTYEIKGSTGLNYQNGTEKWRFLSEISGQPTKSRISDIITVGVSGSGIEKTTYNGVPAIKVPYQSDKLFIDVGFVYSSAVYIENAWNSAIVLGRKTRSDGKSADWKLDRSDENWPGTSTKVGIGLLIMEVSTDKVNWKTHKVLNLSSDLPHNEWYLEGQMIASSVYVRISYAFRIYCEAYQTGFLNLEKRPKEFYNIIEVSNVFFIGVDGFGKEDPGVMTFKNLNEGDLGDFLEAGYTIEEARAADTLTNNSMTTSGFKVVPIGYENHTYSSYKATVYHNGSPAVIDEDIGGYTKEGKYEITIESIFGTKKTWTIFIYNDSLTSLYFGMPFARSLTDVAFIQGQRLLSGSNQYLKDLGINYTYQWSDIPVFKKGCTYNLKDVTGISSPLEGYIYVSTDQGDEVIEIAAGNSGTLNKVGRYQAILYTVNDVGDIINFHFDWWVVENDPGPEINQSLLKISNQIYDLVPVYYSVIQEYGPYTYYKDGQPIEKAGRFNFAFRYYEDALAFALRIEKQKVTEEGENFRYGNKLYTSEYTLFVDMKKNAINNITKEYFNINEEYTVRGLNWETITSEDGYILSSSNPNDVNTTPIVVLDEYEREKLTQRQPIINDFKFISAFDYDSIKVEMIDQKGKRYQIEYDSPVGEQLRMMYAPTGKYIVEETNCYNQKSVYEVYYIDSGDDNTIELDLTIETIFNQETIKINYLNDLSSYTANVGFQLSNIKNINDSYSLVLIMKYDNYNEKRMYDAYSVFESGLIQLNELGRYEIILVDRVGNQYQFELNIVAPEKVIALFNNDGIIETREVLPRSELILPVPSKPGYQFIGWEDQLGNLYNGAITSYPFVDEHTFTARWEIKRLKIVFQSPYLWNQIAPIYAYYGSQYYIYEPSIDENYLFLYWEVVETKDRIYPGLINYDYDFDITLKAVAMPISGKVRVVFNDGSQSYSVDAEPGSTFTFPDASLQGYSFVGWESDEGIIYEGEVDEFPYYYDTEFVALFIPKEYLVEFIVDDVVIDSNYYLYGETIVTPDIPVKEADLVYTYQFESWSNTQLVVNGNMTIVANFTKTYINYTVVFYNYDQSIISSHDQYHYGDQIVIPNTPQRNPDERFEYEFIGWDKEVENSVTGNLEYVAKYKSIPRQSGFQLPSYFYYIMGATIIVMIGGAAVYLIKKRSL